MVSLRRKRLLAEAAAAAARRLAIHKLRRIQRKLLKLNKEEHQAVSAIKQKSINRRNAVYKRRIRIVRKIPCFWYTVFKKNPKLTNLVKTEDRKIFRYLDTVNVEDFHDPSIGYYIAFYFKPNPFFHNMILTKTIIFLDGGAIRSIGTVIEWKAVKGPVDHVGNGGKVTDVPLPDSFFSWFDSPEDDVEVEKDLVAKIIKEEIWPNPIGLRNHSKELVTAG